MIRLVARSLDRRAAAILIRPGRPRIHAVFERAVNLLTADGDLLGVVGPRGGNGPATLVLAEPPPGSFEALGVRPGGEARIERGRLRLSPLLEVDPGGAAVWERPPVIPGPPEAVARRAEAAARQALAERGDDGLGPLLLPLPLGEGWGEGRLPLPEAEGRSEGLSPLATPALPAVAALLAAWETGDASGVAAATARLAGLGPGLTPSGDDLLAGLCVTTARLDAPDWRRLAAAVARAADGRTTTVGLARIRYAAEGELDERSERAVAAILQGPDEAVEPAVADLLAFGHSSGLDTLVGVLLGLDNDSVAARWLRAAE